LSNYVKEIFHEPEIEPQTGEILSWRFAVWRNHTLERQSVTGWLCWEEKGM